MGYMYNMSLDKDLPPWMPKEACSLGVDTQTTSQSFEGRPASNCSTHLKRPGRFSKFWKRTASSLGTGEAQQVVYPAVHAASQEDDVLRQLQMSEVSVVSNIVSSIAPVPAKTLKPCMCHLRFPFGSFHRKSQKSSKKCTSQCKPSKFQHHCPQLALKKGVPSPPPKSTIAWQANVQSGISSTKGPENGISHKLKGAWTSISSKGRSSTFSTSIAFDSLEEGKVGGDAARNKRKVHSKQKVPSREPEQKLSNNAFRAVSVNVENPQKSEVVADRSAHDYRNNSTDLKRRTVEVSAVERKSTSCRLSAQGDETGIGAHKLQVDGPTEISLLPRENTLPALSTERQGTANREVKDVAEVKPSAGRMSSSRVSFEATPCHVDTSAQKEMNESGPSLDSIPDIAESPSKRHSVQRTTLLRMNTSELIRRLQENTRSPSPVSAQFDDPMPPKFPISETKGEVPLETEKGLHKSQSLLLGCASDCKEVVSNEPQTPQTPHLPSSPKTTNAAPKRSISRQGTMGTEKMQELQKSFSRSLSMKPTEAVHDKLNFMQVECAVKFTAKERLILKGYFELHDNDTSGTLCSSELLVVMDDIDRIPKEGSEDETMLTWLFQSTDVDQSGELDFEEFTQLMQLYYHGVYFRVFHGHDDDASGNISISELSDCMKDLEESGFKVGDTEIKELFDRIDNDGDGMLSWDEWVELMAEYRGLEFTYLEQRAGFTDVQIEYLQKLFDDADDDGSGNLDLREVVTLLECSNMGKSLTDPKALDEFVDIFARMDEDRSASLDFLEFIRLLRVWDKKACRPDVFEQNIQSYYDQKKLLESQKQHKAPSKKKTFSEDFRDQVVDTVENRVMQKHYGLSMEELEALREDFIFSDTDGSGKIGETELPMMLKNCGTQPTTRIQKEFLKSCLADLKRGGTMFDYAGVVKLHVEYNAACVKYIFKDKDHINTSELVVVFYQLGQYMNREEVNHLLVEVGAGLEVLGGSIKQDVFEKIFEMRRIHCLSKWRSTYGFDSAQIQRFKQAFDANSSKRKLMSLETVPNVVKTLGFKNQELVDIALDRFRLSLQHDDQVSWCKYLLLLKHLETLQMKQNINAQQDIVEKVGLDDDAYRQLQEVFKSYIDTAGGLVSKKGIQLLFSSMGVAKTQEQRKTLRDSLDNIETEALGFSQFLQILFDLDSSGEFCE
eukprot:gnl/MRDRNA2_/MRDRNA2_27629_c0_seq1.p1 gnl/MRDRNA2_/MRDRNA2_27629_c0~~gnl/MRDRNA2_/MRDRNA2_27629_c0_seq1.p1  ORF type:complete len:1180 (+),score=241.13 gnl/MRDRNA2_/MRDRNA2_27629_c0_seq1:138-3677(+)